MKIILENNSPAGDGPGALDNTVTNYMLRVSVVLQNLSLALLILCTNYCWNLLFPVVRRCQPRTRLLFSGEPPQLLDEIGAAAHQGSLNRSTRVDNAILGNGVGGPAPRTAEPLPRTATPATVVATIVPKKSDSTRRPTTLDNARVLIFTNCGAPDEPPYTDDAAAAILSSSPTTAPRAGEAAPSENDPPGVGKPSAPHQPADAPAEWKSPDYCKLTIPNMRGYARRHGYSFLNIRMPGARQGAFWSSTANKGLKKILMMALLEIRREWAAHPLPPDLHDQRGRERSG